MTKLWDKGSIFILIFFIWSPLSLNFHSLSSHSKWCGVFSLCEKEQIQFSCWMFNSLWNSFSFSFSSSQSSFSSSVSLGEEKSLRLPVGHGGAGVRGADGRRLHHHGVRKQHEQQRLRHRHAARQPLQRPLLPEVSQRAQTEPQGLTVSPKTGGNSGENSHSSGSNCQIHHRWKSRCFHVIVKLKNQRKIFRGCWSNY